MHHITPLANLESILRSKALIARNFLENNFIDTADNNIIIKRQNVDGNNLNDYVPFHNDHLQKKYGIAYNYNVCRSNGKENMIFLIFDPNNITISPNNVCLFYLYHPVCIHKILCNNLGTLAIKMEEEEEKLPKRSLDNRLNFKSKKVQDFLMSEILVFRSVSLDYLEKIYVSNIEIKNNVELLLKNYNLTNIEVIIDNDFYKC